MLEPTLVAHLLERQAEQMPVKIATVDRTGVYTYAELNALARQVACWLQDVGVKPGDRVVLRGANGARLVAAIFGILKAGAIFVPLHPDTPAARIAYVLQNCTPAAFVADSQILLRRESAMGEFGGPLLLVSDTIPDCRTRAPNVTPWTVLAHYDGYSWDGLALPTDLAAIIYTSGSAKEPRGVMLPHRQVVFATTAINRVIGNTSEDVILCGLPLSFDYGLYQVFLTFQVGAKLILERDFRLPMVIPRLIREHSVTGFPGVPSLFAMLLQSRLLERIPLPSLRYITSTGDVFPAAHIRRLQELMPHVIIFPMYGLTECKRVSIMPRGKLRGRESSVGLPLSGTSVSVIDEAGQEVPCGAIGELVVRGPHVMAGYWNDPVETARRFRVDVSNGATQLYTGDHFRMDEAGFLYFMGRGEMFIKSRGQKISPLEIESVVYEIDGVNEVAAIGVPDPILGESVYVFVSPSSSSTVDLKRINERCRESLPSAAYPRRVIVMESLPKTENGKIDRVQLKMLAAESTKT